MNIRIKELNVQNLGPIKELSLDLKSINLIYGDNEKGKSYLVEFLIRSLFKTTGWKLRRKTGSGKVTVEGLKDSIIEFSPSSTVKLEDFLSEKCIGLPPDFSKLLVLRSTNVELGKEEESNRIMLRRFLSHKEIFDKIKEHISNTIIDSQVEGYKIEGAKRGEIKKREELEEELNRIDELFKEIESKFLGGKRKILEDNKKELENRYEKLDKAKRYLAYTISKEIQKLNEQIDRIDEEKINGTLTAINTLNVTKKGYIRKNETLDNLIESTKHYEWLENAVEEYKEYNLARINLKPNIWYPISLVFIFVSAIVFALLKIPVGGLFALVVLAGISYMYKRKYDKFLADAGKKGELLSLREEYKERFGEELKNLAVMNEKLENMKENYVKSKILGEELGKTGSEINIEKLKIAEEIKNLIGEEIEMGKWEENLNSNLNKRKNLAKQVEEKRIKLEKLLVDASNYVEEKPDLEFDNNEYKNIGKELDNIKENISKKDKDFNLLKQSICEHTKDEFSIDWMRLIKNLADKHNELLNEYKNLAAEIIGKKCVSEIIEEMYKEEDKKIKDALDSGIIKEIIATVTGHYNNIYLEGNNMIASDPYNNFPVSDISDGAKEQVFLALRVGFATYWFKKDRLFLILDDAFLHSDNKRRPLLVDKILELGKSGWQIICFTFDDSIKRLFDRKVKKFGDDYRFYNLNET